MLKTEITQDCLHDWKFLAPTNLDDWADLTNDKVRCEKCGWTGRRDMRTRGME